MKVKFSKKAKQAISALTMVSVISGSQVAYSAVPVIDPTAIAQAVKQVQNQIKQIENLRNQLKAVTGNARLGVLLNDPNVQRALGKYTPKGISLSDLASGNYDRTLQQIAKRIEQDMKKQQQSADPKVQLAQATLLNYAQVEQSITDLDKLAKQSAKIANQINATTDASSKADLANTLSANNSQIQIAIAQINLKMKQMEMLEKRAQRLVIDDFDRKQNR